MARENVRWGCVWVAQQARNATMDLGDRALSTRFLLRDHHARFTRAFDEMFRSEGAQGIRTPLRAPKANAHAERWVQTVRVGCLDWTLLLGRCQLLWLLRGSVRHHNQQRPHRALARFWLWCLVPAGCLLSGSPAVGGLLWDADALCRLAVIDVLAFQMLRHGCRVHDLTDRLLNGRAQVQRVMTALAVVVGTAFALIVGGW